MVAQASARYSRSPRGTYQRPQPRESLLRNRAEDTEADDPDLSPIVKYLFLRSVLDPQYASLPNKQLEALMEGQFGEGAAEQYDEYLEGFFGDVGNFISGAARDVGRVAAKAAPVVANIAGGVV